MSRFVFTPTFDPATWEDLGSLLTADGVVACSLARAAIETPTKKTVRRATRPRYSAPSPAPARFTPPKPAPSPEAIKQVREEHRQAVRQHEDAVSKMTTEVLRQLTAAVQNDEFLRAHVTLPRRSGNELCVMTRAGYTFQMGRFKMPVLSFQTTPERDVASNVSSILARLRMIKSLDELAR